MKYRINGQLYDPIKMGDEGDFYEDADRHETCGDCGVCMGEYHIAGCDCERCPVPECGCQLISCDCGTVEEVYDEDESNQEDSGVTL